MRGEVMSSVPFSGPELTSRVSVISDRPSEAISEAARKAGITSVRDIFDDYLVSSRGKVFYHVHWERVDGKYENLSGEPVNKLPAWASADKLLGGYHDPAATREQPRYDNPVEKHSR
jgi:hypothetical protein